MQRGEVYRFKVPKGVGHERQGFLLESVEGGERVARYSFIGADPLYVREQRV